MSDESLRARLRAGADLAPEDLSALLASALRAGELASEREALATVLLTGAPAPGERWALEECGFPVIARALGGAVQPVLEREEALEGCQPALEVLRRLLAAPDARSRHLADWARSVAASGIALAKEGGREDLLGAARSLTQALEVVVDPPKRRVARRSKALLQELGEWAGPGELEAAWRELVEWTLGEGRELPALAPLRELLARGLAGERSAWLDVEAWGRCCNNGYGGVWGWVAGFLGAPTFAELAEGMQVRPESLERLAAELCPQREPEGGYRWGPPGYLPRSHRDPVFLGHVLGAPDSIEVPVRAAVVLAEVLGEEERARAQAAGWRAWLGLEVEERGPSPRGPDAEPWSWGAAELVPLAERAAGRGDAGELTMRVREELIAWALGLDGACRCGV